MNATSTSSEAEDGSFTAVPRSARWKLLLLWFVLAAYVASAPFLAGDPKYGTLVMFCMGFVLMLVHGTERYGWRGLLTFMALAAIVSITLENMSINTGFPFGWYHYEVGRLRIMDAPVVVALVYISVGYLAWTVGNLILGFCDDDIGRPFNTITLPLVATFVMVQFDVVQDPATSTFAKIWVWHHGGGYFGVPLSNFLGWYFTCWIFMQAFAIFVARRPRTVRTTVLTRQKRFWLPPVLFYAAIGLTYIFQYAANADRTLVDETGKSWSLSNLYETAVIVMLFTMLPSAIIAIVKLLDSKTQRRAGA